MYGQLVDSNLCKKRLRAVVGQCLSAWLAALSAGNLAWSAEAFAGYGGMESFEDHGVDGWLLSIFGETLEHIHVVIGAAEGDSAAFGIGHGRAAAFCHGSISGGW